MVAVVIVGAVVVWFFLVCYVRACLPGMDLITGKSLREIFFDPEACLDLDKADVDWLIEHLYHPVFVTQDLGRELVISTGQGDHEVLLRMVADKCTTVANESKEGANC